MAVLVDKSTPAVVAFFYTIPHSKGRRQRGPGKTTLFDVAHRLARRVLLTKLFELDGDVHPYPATLMVATLAWACEPLVMLEGIRIMMMTREAFNNMMLKEASCNYNNYRLVSR